MRIEFAEYDDTSFHIFTQQIEIFIRFPNITSVILSNDKKTLPTESDIKKISSKF